MNKELIKNALKEALYLISDEYQSLMNEDLKINYESVIEKLEKAIQEIEKVNG